MLHFSSVTHTQACTLGGGDIPNELCDRLREITLPDDISDSNVNKSMNVLALLRDATVDSISLVEEKRLAFESHHNSTVSYVPYRHTHTHAHTHMQYIHTYS